LNTRSSGPPRGRNDGARSGQAGPPHGRNDGAGSGQVGDAIRERRLSLPAVRRPQLRDT
jgi:hypothetical protein